MGKAKKWEWRKGYACGYVTLRDDGRLEWCGWDDHPGGGGAVVHQEVSEFLEFGKPGPGWIDLPEDILIELRQMLLAQLND